MAEHTIKSVDRDVRFECIVMRQEFLRRFSSARWEIKHGDVWWNLRFPDGHERAYQDHIAGSIRPAVCDLVTLHGNVHFKRFPSGEWEINHSDETWVRWPSCACEEALYQAYIKE
jgi:hypothetical protein